MTKAERKEYKHVLSRDNFRCQVCGKPYAHIHHVQFKSLQGANIRQNLICLCEPCHRLCHADSAYWKPILLDKLRLHYGCIEIEDLKKKSKYAEFKFSK